MHQLDSLSDRSNRYYLYVEESRSSSIAPKGNIILITDTKKTKTYISSSFSIFIKFLYTLFHFCTLNDIIYSIWKYVMVGISKRES